MKRRALRVQSTAVQMHAKHATRRRFSLAARAKRRLDGLDTALGVEKPLDVRAREEERPAVGSVHG